MTVWFSTVRIVRQNQNVFDNIIDVRVRIQVKLGRVDNFVIFGELHTRTAWASEMKSDWIRFLVSSLGVSHEWGMSEIANEV